MFIVKLIIEFLVDYDLKQIGQSFKHRVHWVLALSAFYILLNTVSIIPLVSLVAGKTP
jgi:hypothetical protein